MALPKKDTAAAESLLTAVNRLYSINPTVAAEFERVCNLGVPLAGLLTHGLIDKLTDAGREYLAVDTRNADGLYEVCALHPGISFGHAFTLLESSDLPAENLTDDTLNGRPVRIPSSSWVGTDAAGTVTRIYTGVNAEEWAQNGLYRREITATRPAGQTSPIVRTTGAKFPCGSRVKFIPNDYRGYPRQGEDMITGKLARLAVGSMYRDFPGETVYAVRTDDDSASYVRESQIILY